MVFVHDHIYRRNREIGYRAATISFEPSEHLSNYPDPKFTCNIILSAPQTIKRKILEAYYIAKYKPKLNEQISSRPV